MIIGFISLCLFVAAATASDDMAIWAKKKSTAPSFALWNGAGFSNPGDLQSSSTSHKKDGWKFIRGAYSATRDEAIVIGVDKKEIINAQMYLDGRWNELPFSPMTSRSSTAKVAGFDVAYESRTGNAVLVWKEMKNAVIITRVWNGKSWGREIRTNMLANTDEHNEFHLRSNPRSNEMVLCVDVLQDSDFCLVWDGEKWDNIVNLNNGIGPANVAYEQQSGRAIVVYGKSSPTAWYRMWEGNRWDEAGPVEPAVGINHDVSRIAIDSDPSSNQIVLGVTASLSNAYWLAIWNGSANWGSKQIAAPSSNALSFPGLAVAFESNSGRAIAAYGQASNQVRYRIWTNKWSNQLTGPDIQVRPNSILLSSSHDSNMIALAVQDSEAAAKFCMWDGNSWGRVYKMVDETGQSEGTPLLFMWKPSPGLLGAALSTQAPTRAPTLEPTPNPTQPSTRAPTQNPTTNEPTNAPSVDQSVGCINDPEGWHDSYGEQYDCVWYARDNNCEQYGDFFSNLGATANEACCACDGGKMVGSVPTVLPTASPTRTPTSSPTPNPTPLPTQAPTRKPTQSPTQSPTPAPTADPTPNPTPSPTSNPTPSPTSSPTPSPTPSPTNKPTTAPSNSPTSKPTLSTFKEPRASSVPDQEKDFEVSRGVGKLCDSDNECQSNSCRNGACMASDACYPIKHEFGTPFHKHRINIVFVASAFDSVGHDAWRDQVSMTYRFMQNYNMFAEEIKELNVFMVDPESLDSSFCDFGCQGIDRLLCCDVRRAQSLANNCFPVGSNLQTVIIHNSEKFGGAGYVEENVATLSTHSASPLVAVHELGHSLFELGDEYSYGDSTDALANCDSSQRCDRWSDLTHPPSVPSGYKKAKCLKGCAGKKYYVSEKTFMEDLSSPVGVANERFTCCTYLALTKQLPSYCRAFDLSPGYLLNYCKGNDYQNYGSSNYESEDVLAIPGYANNDKPTTKYRYLSSPVQVTITPKRKRSGNMLFRTEQTPLIPGMFLKKNVEGDFSSPKAASKRGETSFLKVMIFYRTGGKETLFVSQNTTVDIPLPEPNSTTTDQQPGEYMHVSEMSGSITLVLDAKERGIKRIRTKLIEL